MNDFFAMLFEFWGQNVSILSDDLYDEGMYTNLGVITILLAGLTAAIYYYIDNSPRRDQWYHWLLYGGIISIIALVVTYIHVNSKFDYLGLQYITADYLNICITVLVYTLFTYFILSMLMKWGSKNCRRSPF